MGGNEFHFRRFSIRQGSCAMKVGTDGVLLGAWCRIEPWQRRMLDVGTGTGLIGLMAAQRSEGFAAPLRIEAVEIERAAAGQAAANFAASPWAERLAVRHAAVQEFAAANVASYDHIVSNPPYFSEALLCPAAERTVARHTAALTWAELVRAVVAMLAPEGIFSVVLPASAALSMNMEAGRQGLCLLRRTWVRTKSGAPAKRLLAEYGRRAAGGIEETELTILSPQGAYTDAYRLLTYDFYLSV